MTQTTEPATPTPTPNQPVDGGSLGLRDPAQLATAAGLVTVAIGGALTARPVGTSRLLGLGLGARGARLLGATDLIVGPALLRGQRRTPWMALRTALNLGIAAQYGRAARSSAHPRVARTGLGVMAVITVFDGVVALGLARRERKQG